MNAIALLLMQFDRNWNHNWESLQSVLKDVTPDEATFQGPCYAAEEREANMPPPGSILGQLVHIHWCNLHYANVIRLRPQKEIADPPQPPVMSLQQTIDALHGSHDALRAEVAKLTEADLAGACGHGAKTLAEFLASCLRHEIWHAGQIALARRLYRHRQLQQA
ncbi:MAG TPA: DinB family protein [Planctomycetota bacterium]|jgi:uncharacterized damage-inducible protein DinB